MILAVAFVEQALRDADKAFTWYESQRRGLGLEFLSAVDAAIHQVQRLPDAHPVVRKRTRRAIVRRFPYVLLYSVESEVIVVLALFHVRQDPRSWADRVRDGDPVSELVPNASGRFETESSTPVTPAVRSS